MADKKTAKNTIDLMQRLQESLAASKRRASPQWYCIECDCSDDSADIMTMHSANTGHQPFYGTMADRDHHRGVLAKGTTVPAGRRSEGGE